MAGEKQRPFGVKPTGDSDKVIRYYGPSDVQVMREMGYGVEPVVDPNKKVVRFVVLSQGKRSVNCEICEDMSQSPVGVMKADRKIFLDDGTTR